MSRELPERAVNGSGSQFDPASIPEAIAEAVRRLRDGCPVAFPTETVYGLAADATDQAAIARVFAIKERPSSNPLIVHVTGPEMARRVVADWTDGASKLARAFWPGPLSLVLPKGELVPDIVTAGGLTVAVRAPNHPVALALLEAFGGPLVGPSANPSGSVSPTTAAHVRSAWSDEDVFVIDGGPCTVGIESTVLGLPPHHYDQPTVLRLGAISADQIAACLGREVKTRSSAEADGQTDKPAASPGLLHAHYQPRAKVVMNPTDSVPGEVVIELPTDAELAATMLYASLRDADAGNPSRIVVRLELGGELGGKGEAHTQSPLWNAILDRLNRACASS